MSLFYYRFYDYGDAQDAMEGMDKRMFENRELRVQMDRYGRPALPPQTPPQQQEMEVQPNATEASTSEMEL